LDGFEELKTTLVIFTTEVCEALGQVDVPLRMWTRIVHGDGHVSFPQEERRDFVGPPFGIIQALHQDPPESFSRVVNSVRADQELVDLILVDGSGNPIANENDLHLWVANIFGGAFLRSYFNNIGRPEFDQEAFEKTFSRLMGELQSTAVITATEISPLINAHLDVEGFELAPGIAIRKLTSDETETWLNQSIQGPLNMTYGLQQIDFSSLDCAIEATYEKARHEAWGARRDITEGTSDFITAVRLLTDRSVHIAFTRRRSDSILEPGGGTSSSLRPRLPGTVAEISPSMQPDLIATWNRLREIPIDSSLRLALRRWDMVAERVGNEDALIDYWIAIEALFAPDSASEVRFRVSLRVSAFIGTSPQEREGIYKDLRDSYDLRSRIVHGGVVNTQKRVQLEEKTRAYLRTILITLLQSEGAFDPRSIEIDLLRQ